MHRLLLLLTLLLTACDDRDGIPKPIQVTYLFTQGECKVFRFWDEGYPHYFATCPGSLVTSQRPDGKVHRPEDVLTFPGSQ